MYRDLVQQENERATLFKRELREKEAEDILDKAILKAYHAKLNGVLPASEFHRINEKVQALKKLQFAEEYEFHHDKEMYEWIKFKTAAQIGGQEEREALHLYEK